MENNKPGPGMVLVQFINGNTPILCLAGVGNAQHITDRKGTVRVLIIAAGERGTSQHPGRSGETIHENVTLEVGDQLTCTVTKTESVLTISSGDVKITYAVKSPTRNSKGGSGDYAGPVKFSNQPFEVEIGKYSRIYNFPNNPFD